MNMSRRLINLVFVGDGTSKKTELLFKYTFGIKFYKDFLIPRNNIQDIIVDRVRYSVYFVDAESDDDYIILRRNAIIKADCILLCYSVGNKQSFENVSSKWCIEIRKCSPRVPIILVGTGTEIRNDEKSECVSIEEGENLKHLIGAFAFVECSIEKFIGVDEIFIQAVRSTYRY